MNRRVLEVENLTIESVATRAPVVRGVNLAIAPGEVLAIIGESGSGKTTLGLTALGHIRPGLKATSGRVLLDGADVLTLDPAMLCKIRGSHVAYVAQSAAASFNPSLMIGEQVIEPALVHRIMPANQARARSLELYGELALPDPVHIGARYPHQVSGGQLQRLMAAMAICCGPKLLILDEPTTALDVTTQIGVLEAFKRAIRHQGAAALYISHDLALVSQIADRILVIHNGVVQEEGSSEAVITAPKAPYTRTLLAACKKWTPGAVAAPTAIAGPPLLNISNVTAGYGRNRDQNPVVVAVKSVDLVVRRSSVLAIIGESGSGKSTLARVVAGLLPPARGTIQLAGERLPDSVQKRSKDALRRIQMVFQSPDVALNPAHTVGQILGRPLTLFRGKAARERGELVRDLLEMVQLPPEFERRKPDQLSGGQKQRVNLARALAADPELILCDEITSALDTIVAASIIELLRRLRTERGLAFMFITHDISTAASFADEIAVMHRGEIVERGPTDEVLNRPQHAYTKILVASVPQLQAGWLEGAVARRKRLLGAGGLAMAD
ncbi:ABC transporter ATP-binding protein [Bradyrhizobium sp. SSUT18]|uniref:ABC transporter ATP-binding protein n=1 Tax=Bradyrhizobium sp. SSUT18 TaxID=3040602 RepID=UPI00244AC9D6|nr:ABC transporter ATP-binding protein [Bradyrhizobium sp. SSUT18]MDH2405275.1 ABC transporter ATP-binding protein [Bradyrhizobium sp. SSUT18]